MSKKNTPLITVTIPTYNREIELINTINDLLKHQTEKRFELFVIDQTKHHKPETQKALESIKDDRFKYFHVSPPSLPAARNFALIRANAPYILFLDDDIKPNNKLVEIVLNTFELMPEISAVAGRVLQEGFPIKKEVLKFDIHSVSHGVFTATEPSFTNAFPGGNCALKVKDALDLSGFDTRYKGTAFREESDMALKMISSGHKIYYEPKAEIFHLAAKYGGTRVKTHIYDNPNFYRNEMFFTLRHADKKHKMRALLKKFREYCMTEKRHVIPIRSIYYIQGIVAAVWRILFSKQITAEEINK